jgi:serine/threonine protein kinase
MVGEYRVDQAIGEGTFGKVYAATHPVIGKTAAIKVLGLEHASNPQSVSRFVEEARAVNTIQHRGIVDIFSFGKLPDGRHYFVMELLKGKTLSEFIKARGRVPIGEAIPIVRGIARALDAAHAKGIAHRDLKPDNIFLTIDDDGAIFPKLLDFGIAKLMGDSPLGNHRTATGTPMGTPLYMSPEQCKGRNIDHRTDVYSFGVVLHEMLTGRPPFDAPNVMDVMMGHMSKAPPSVSSMTPIPNVIDAVVLRMLDKDPEKRHQAVGKAVDALVFAARSAGIEVPASEGGSAQNYATGPGEGSSPRKKSGPHAPGPPAGFAVAPTEHASVQTHPSAGHSPPAGPSAAQAYARPAAPPPQAYGGGYAHGQAMQTYQPATHPLQAKKGSNVGTKIALFIGGGCLAIFLLIMVLLVIGIAVGTR